MPPLTAPTPKIGSDKGQTARRLHRIFPEARILFTLRRQQDVVTSFYVTRLRRDIERKVMLPFDEWFKRALREPHMSILDDLRYDRLLACYAELFGAENVRVLLYEDLTRDAEGYYRSLAEILDVEPESFAALLRGRRENVAISRGYLAFWQSLGPLVPRKLTKKLALRMPRYRGAPARIELKAEQRDALMAIIGDGNRRLSDRWHLDLCARGYLV